MSTAPELVDILPGHRFDVDALRDYLRGKVEGVDESFSIKQFQGGQSNPTFLITAGSRRYVLRKKPPGKLLPKAHQIEREYKVMNALRDTDVPVPNMQLLCEEEGIIGTPFYVMNFLDGRVMSQPELPEVDKAERRPLFESLADTLARLHNVDWKAVGLEDFGRPEGYVARQVHRWSKQYEASKTDEIPAMENLMKWLGENIPAEDETAIAHGDYRHGNVIFHSERPEVIAVLDWELATLGHPLADLAYFCMPYHLPHGAPAVRGLLGIDLEEQGLPSEEEVLEIYRKRAGRADIPHWRFFLAFSMFRIAAILQGVYARALQGNASNADALKVGGGAATLAEAGWDLAQKA
ncbi:phosphotransferase family protein [Ectothiorhodospiraceae bacterium WFHF3C12]|nr:phosphotransferase family protein [Ectothiorhodospiraceae bacterium WFHF3C12]